MAILVCSNDALKQPETWELIDVFFDTIEVVEVNTLGTVFRVQNDEVPKEDILIDIIQTVNLKGIHPFVHEIKVYHPYKFD